MRSGAAIVALFAFIACPAYATSAHLRRAPIQPTTKLAVEEVAAKPKEKKEASKKEAGKKEEKAGKKDDKKEEKPKPCSNAEKKAFGKQITDITKKNPVNTKKLMKVANKQKKAMADCDKKSAKKAKKKAKKALKKSMPAKGSAAKIPGKDTYAKDTDSHKDTAAAVVKQGKAVDTAGEGGGDKKKGGKKADKKKKAAGKKADKKALIQTTACVNQDLEHRAQLQNKLAGVCVDMCKEVGAFPKCTCPNFVAPDSTPGVMTWPELLEHLDNLSEWGHGQLKAWTKQASQLQIEGMQNERACLADDLKHRMQVQNKLAGVCVDMCKEVGAFPKCTCPDFVAPDSTPGVMTWPELLEHMDNLSEWGHGELKAWTNVAR